MTKEELDLWLKIDPAIDWCDHDIDECGNENNTGIYVRDGKLFAVDFFNYDPYEEWGDNGRIRESYKPREVIAKTKMVEITEYVDVE